MARNRPKTMQGAWAGERPVATKWEGWRGPRGGRATIASDAPIGSTRHPTRRIPEESAMANKNPLKGLPSERKVKQLDKARRKAETRAREKVERREAGGLGNTPGRPGQGTLPPTGAE